MLGKAELKRKLISTGSEFEKTLGYSRAVVQGDWCFVAGTTGYDYVKMKMPASAAQQASNAFETIKKTLESGGFAPGHIVRVQYTITDAAIEKEITPVLGKYMGQIKPAATMVVAGLTRPQMKVEIEVTAFKG